MADYEVYDVSDGVQIVCVPADRFKTNEISVSFACPLTADTAAVNAVNV